MNLTPAPVAAQPASPYQGTNAGGYPTNQPGGGAPTAFPQGSPQPASPWTQQQGYPPQPQPQGYPQQPGYGQQQGYAPPPQQGYAPPPASQGWQAPPPQGFPPDDSFDGDDQPRSRRSIWLSLRGVLLVQMLLTVFGVGVTAVEYYPTLCSLRARHALRQDMPLPCGIALQDYIDRSASGTTGKGSSEWVFSVTNTTPAQIRAFYQEQLPTAGWTIPPTAQDTAQFPDALLACKDVAAIIQSTNQQNPDDGVDPPRGAILLVIIFVPLKNLPDAFCSSTT
jgi:hypothetical protein